MNSAVSTAVDTAVNTGQSVNTAVNTAVNSAVSAAVNTGVSTSVAVSAAVDALKGMGYDDKTANSVVNNIVSSGGLTSETSAAATTQATTKPKTTGKTSPADLSAAFLPAIGGGAPRDTIGPQFLKSFETQGYIDPLAKVKEVQAELQGQDLMQQVDPRLAAILQQRMGQQQQQDQESIGALAKMLSGEPEAANTPYYAYGEEEPISAIMGGRGYAQGGYVAPLMAKEGGMTLPLMAKKGGLPREDFRDGKHVAGDGDGQSDDIPAWLADGEFVFPADVVSALGNGSTKAGTDKLYEMMHAIRSRARSKGPKDLPPPALKSPLDYLKSKK